MKNFLGHACFHFSGNALFGEMENVRVSGIRLSCFYVFCLHKASKLKPYGDPFVVFLRVLFK